MRNLRPHYFAAALCAACTGSPGTSGPVSVAAASSAGALLPSLPPPSWDDRRATTSRQAVLIAADSYRAEPAWAMPSAKRSAGAIRDSLSAHCGFGRDDVHMLTGKEVTTDLVRAAIRDAVATARGEDQLVLVYYAGHGWVDADGRLQLFGYATEAVRGSFAYTIGRDDLVGWLAGTTATLIVDACRPNLAAPPPRARLLRSKVWEVYGVQDGGFAAAGGDAEAHVFTAALVEMMRNLARTGTSVGVDEVWRAARDETLRRTGEKQRPDMLSPEGGSSPALVVPPRVSFAVRVVDHFTSTLRSDVTLRVDDRTLTAVDGVVGVTAAPSAHVLTVSCEGYLARTESVVLSESHNGRTLTFGLLPAAVIVRGRVEPAATVRVRARTDGNARLDYHVMDATSRGDGAFELRVPRLRGEVQVLVEGEVARSIPLPTRPTGLIQSVPYVDVAIGVDGIAGLAHTVAGAPTATPTFSAEIDRKDWERVLRNVQAGDFALARSTLSGLPRSTESEAWRLWIDNRWVEQGLRDGLRKGMEMGDWNDVAEVMAWLPQNRDRLEDPARVEAMRAEAQRERIPLATRQAIARADEAFLRGDFELAWTEYGKAESGANAHYRRQIASRKEVASVQLYDRHMNAGQAHESNGELERAVQSYNRATQFSERAMESVERVMRKLAARARQK